MALIYQYHYTTEQLFKLHDYYIGFNNIISFLEWLSEEDRTKLL